MLFDSLSKNNFRYPIRIGLIIELGNKQIKQKVQVRTDISRIKGIDSCIVTCFEKTTNQDQREIRILVPLTLP